jgi:hypothetical protein
MATIQIDDRGVRHPLDGGKLEQVAWDDLQEVTILTTSGGPFVEDVFFLLMGSNGTGCVIPQSAPECTLLLERLQRLPGFDNAAVISAMSCAEDQKFICWRRHPISK